MTREEMKAHADWAARQAILASSPLIREQLLKLREALLLLSKSDEEVQAVAERMAGIRPLHKTATQDGH